MNTNNLTCTREFSALHGYMQELSDRAIVLRVPASRLNDGLQQVDKMGEVTRRTIKGRILVIRTDVAYSTLTVTLNAAVPQAELRELMPFDWVRGLGEGIMTETQVDFRPSQLSSTKLRLAWPADYVKVAQRREEVRAMSGEVGTILVSRHENFENGALAFWSPLVRRWLVASRVLSISEEKDFTGATGGRGRLFVATKTVGVTV